MNGRRNGTLRTVLSSMLGCRSLRKKEHARARQALRKQFHLASNYFLRMHTHTHVRYNIPRCVLYVLRGSCVPTQINHSPLNPTVPLRTQEAAHAKGGCRSKHVCHGYMTAWLSTGGFKLHTSICFSDIGKAHTPVCFWR